jgi:hypothetical protein
MYGPVATQIKPLANPTKTDAKITSPRIPVMSIPTQNVKAMQLMKMHHLGSNRATIDGATMENSPKQKKMIIRFVDPNDGKMDVSVEAAELNAVKTKTYPIAA